MKKLKIKKRNGVITNPIQNKTFNYKYLINFLNLKNDTFRFPLSFTIKNTRKGKKKIILILHDKTKVKLHVT